MAEMDLVTAVSLLRPVGAAHRDVRAVRRAR